MLRRSFLFGTVATFLLHASGLHAASRRIAPRKTRLLWDDACNYIAAAGVPEEAVPIMAAQWALETQQGKKMWCWNYAGIKGSSPEGLYCLLRTFEYHKGKKIYVRHRFRAYSTPTLGAQDFVDTIKDTFPEAYDAACKGDVLMYAYMLKRNGYYTTSHRRYYRGLTLMLKRYT